MERETTTLNIENHKLEVKTYATARELNLIQQTYYKGSTIELVGQEPKFSDFNPNVQYEVQKESISQLVVKLDDDTDKIVERCENLPSSVFDLISKALDDIVSKKKN